MNKTLEGKETIMETISFAETSMYGKYILHYFGEDFNSDNYNMCDN